MSIMQLVDRRLQYYPALRAEVIEHRDNLARALGVAGLSGFCLVTANAPPVSGAGWIAVFGLCAGVGTVGALYEVGRLSQIGQDFGNAIELRALSQPMDGEFIT